jgi:hypothetical protein
MDLTHPPPSPPSPKPPTPSKVPSPSPLDLEGNYRGGPAFHPYWGALGAGPVGSTHLAAPQWAAAGIGCPPLVPVGYGWLLLGRQSS